MCFSHYRRTCESLYLNFRLNKSPSFSRVFITTHLAEKLKIEQALVRPKPDLFDSMNRLAPTFEGKFASRANPSGSGGLRNAGGSRQTRTTIAIVPVSNGRNRSLVSQLRNRVVWSEIVHPHGVSGEVHEEILLKSPGWLVGRSYEPPRFPLLLRPNLSKVSFRPPPNGPYENSNERILFLELKFT